MSRTSIIIVMMLSILLRATHEVKAGNSISTDSNFWDALIDVGQVALYFVNNLDEDLALPKLSSKHSEMDAATVALYIDQTT